MRPRYLRPVLGPCRRIYLYRAPIDFRKQAHGLAALVEQQLGHNPFTGALYAFTNRRREIRIQEVSHVGGQRFCALLQALAEENSSGHRLPMSFSPSLPSR